MKIKMEDSSPNILFQELKNEEDFHNLNILIEEGDENIDKVTDFLETHDVSHAGYMDCKCIHKIPSCVYPVITATEKGHVGIMNYLITKGFDHNYLRKDCFIFRFPIHYACRNGHLAVVKSLVIEHGVDANVTDSEGESALAMATYNGSLDIVKFLVESGASVNGNGSMIYSTPLHLAIQRSQADIVDFLISAGADANQNNYYGYPPLSFVPHQSTVEVARMLLDAGANPDAMAPYDTPLVTAVKGNMPKLVKMLYNYGANPETVNKDGYTPLQISVIHEHCEITRYLVTDALVCLDYVGEWSPLKLAIKSGNIKLIYLLMQSGCDLSFKDLGDIEKYSDDDEIIYYVRHSTMMPRKLRQLCYLKIRRILGKRLWDRADYLPLPKLLISFVKLKHIP